jgi:hypothetical protein
MPLYLLLTKILVHVTSFCQGAFDQKKISSTGLLLIIFDPQEANLHIQFKFKYPSLKFQCPAGRNALAVCDCCGFSWAA